MSLLLWTVLWKCLHQLGEGFKELSLSLWFLHLQHLLGPDLFGLVLEDKPTYSWLHAERSV